MPPAPEIALMVLNWNGAELMRRHLPAVLEAAARAPIEARVYVIDNASEDDSREVVASFAGVELIALAENRRLHAYNEAVRRVQCTAFAMLNNDVSPAPDSLAPLWRTMSAEPDVFAVGGEVIDIASGRVDSGPTGARWEHQWVLEPTALEGGSEPIDVAYVSGGAGLYRREMFLELGGFWDALPGLYWEDVELGLRAWMHGWRSVFHPAARFDHASGSTVRRSVNPYLREFRTYQNVRLTHWALLLDRADLRDYLLGELRRSLRKPYYYATVLTLLGSLPTVAARRRALRARCGPVRVSDLQARWLGAGGPPAGGPPAGDPPAGDPPARAPSPRVGDGEPLTPAPPP
jgi:GT2 family glycosyltransferase